MLKLVNVKLYEFTYENGTENHTEVLDTEMIIDTNSTHVTSLFEKCIKDTDMETENKAFIMIYEIIDDMPRKVYKYTVFVTKRGYTIKYLKGIE